jgi:hypothetical protein
MKDVDELSVMRSILNTLGKLDAAAQKRVMLYLSQRVPAVTAEQQAQIDMFGDKAS